jgi:hypothetical protein
VHVEPSNPQLNTPNSSPSGHRSIGTASIDLGLEEFNEEVWGHHDPSIFQDPDSGKYSAPFSDDARTAKFATARAAMLTVQESRTVFSDKQLNWILDKISTSTAPNLFLLSGTQALSYMWQYGSVTKDDGDGSAMATMETLAISQADERFTHKDLAEAKVDLLLSNLYGLYRSGSALGSAASQVKQIVDACQHREQQMGGKCTILSGDVHNAYLAKHSPSLYELTSPSVTAPGLTQKFVATVEDFAGTCSPLLLSTTYNY